MVIALFDELTVVLSYLSDKYVTRILQHMFGY